MNTFATIVHEEPRRNFHPSVWGEDTWNLIHTVALTYPPKPSVELKQQYKNFFETLGKVLPCDSCSVHYAQHLQKYPIDQHLQSPESLFDWTVKLRNTVKRYQVIGKKDAIYYTPKDIKRDYYGEKVKMKLHTVYVVLGIISVILLFYMPKQGISG